MRNLKGKPRNSKIPIANINWKEIVDFVLKNRALDKNYENKNSDFLTTWVQKGVDVKIASDILVKASKNEYDVAVLLAGDSDFEEVIKAVQNQLKKQVELVTFDRFDSRLEQNLLQAVKEHIIIKYENGKGIFWKENIIK